MARRTGVAFIDALRNSSRNGIPGKRHSHPGLDVPPRRSGRPQPSRTRRSHRLTRWTRRNPAACWAASRHPHARGPVRPPRQQRLPGTCAHTTAWSGLRRPERGGVLDGPFRTSRLGSVLLSRLSQTCRLRAQQGWCEAEHPAAAEPLHAPVSRPVRSVLFAEFAFSRVHRDKLRGRARQHAGRPASTLRRA